MVFLIDSEKWAPVIGRLFLAFGRIESTISELLERFVSPGTLSVLNRRPLGERVALLKAVIPESTLTEANQTVLRSNLEDVLRLAKSRNLVAHNPLVLALFEPHEEDGNATFHESIWAGESERHLKFDDLQAIVSEADDLAEALGQNFYALKFDGKILFGTEGPFVAVLTRPSKSSAS